MENCSHYWDKLETSLKNTSASLLNNYPSKIEPFKGLKLEILTTFA